MKRSILISALVAGLSLPLLSQATDFKPEPIARAEEVKIRSAVLNEERELRISKPRSYDQSQASYPVLYVLDADLNFHVTAEIVRYLSAYSLIPEMLVVGVTNTDRNRDMTPNKPKEEGARLATAGGAGNFLKFLGDEAIPFIEKSYRAQPDRTIVGHSLSGLLAVHALLARPDLFSTYIAISPALWWNKFEYFDKIQAYYQSHPSLKKALYVSLADESERDPAVYTRLQDALTKSAPKDLNVQVQFFKQENHISTAIVSVTNALLKLFPVQSANRPSQ